MSDSGARADRHGAGRRGDADRRSRGDRPRQADARPEHDRVGRRDPFRLAGSQALAVDERAERRAEVLEREASRILREHAVARGNAGAGQDDVAYGCAAADPDA